MGTVRGVRSVRDRRVGTTDPPDSRAYLAFHVRPPSVARPPAPARNRIPPLDPDGRPLGPRAARPAPPPPDLGPGPRPRPATLATTTRRPDLELRARRRRTVRHDCNPRLGAGRRHRTRHRLRLRIDGPGVPPHARAPWCLRRLRCAWTVDRLVQEAFRRGPAIAVRGGAARYPLEPRRHADDPVPLSSGRRQRGLRPRQVGFHSPARGRRAALPARDPPCLEARAQRDGDGLPPGYPRNHLPLRRPRSMVEYQGPARGGGGIPALAPHRDGGGGCLARSKDD